MKKIFIATNTFSKHKRQDLCLEKLLLLKENNPNVDVGLIQFESEKIPYQNIPIYYNLKRSSRDIINSTKQLPLFNDLLNTASEISEDIFVYCNSDIILSQKLIDLINSTEIEAFGVSRSEIFDINNLDDLATLVRVEPAGFDCWVISKKWWNEHKNKFPDAFLGKPLFDVLYTMIMFLNSNNKFISNKHLIFHIVHGKESFEKDECFIFNERLVGPEYQKFWKVWNEIEKKTFYLREDWGYFLKFNAEEEKNIEEIKQNYLSS